ncbi:MAG: hypothetical protein GY750_09230 [Lentisphaerae bacterium]|nr:hypothetical protein [Lentisphaerota bacterium]
MESYYIPKLKLVHYEYAVHEGQARHLVFTHAPHNMKTLVDYKRKLDGHNDFDAPKDENDIETFVDSLNSKFMLPFDDPKMNFANPYSVTNKLKNISNFVWQRENIFRHEPCFGKWRSILNVHGHVGEGVGVGNSLHLNLDSNFGKGVDNDSHDMPVLLLCQK